MDIETFTRSDLDDVLGIETRSFRQPWSRKSFMDELSCKESITLVMRGHSDEPGRRVFGYMCGRLNREEMYILKLAVSENCRRYGIASRLLEESIRRAASKNTVSAVLDVRLSNRPAISLYRKHGFQTVGIRPKYYLDTGEDALVMRKQLKEDV